MSGQGPGAGSEHLPLHAGILPWQAEAESEGQVGGEICEDRDRP